jgi:RecB family exonuclease
VDSREDDGVRPSRFLAELGVEVNAADATARRELTVAALVSELRSVVVDVTADEALRRAAAVRLARMAGQEVGSAVLAPTADPDNWWGVRDYSESATPMYPEGAQLRLSASTLSAVEDCGLRWFLDHEVRAESATSDSQGFGRLVHAVAADVAQGCTDADTYTIDRALDRVWDALAFGSAWQSQRERAEARLALARFLAWQQSEVAAGRALVAAEAKFQVEFEVAGRPVVLRGAADRVSITADGRVVIADLKTGRNKPRNDDIVQHVQLGTYQWAVQHGGLAEVLPQEPAGTSAELVHLRLGRDLPAVQTQPELVPDQAGRSWVDELIDSVVAAMEAEAFVAKPSDYCRICSFKSLCPLMDEGRPVIT